MKVGVLTSSRADYSIYYPLLKKLNGDPFFELHILAFGTHLSLQHGRTVDKIKEDGFTVSHEIQTLPVDDQPKSIVKAQAKTMSAFSELFAQESYDLLFALGDRFEMFAAVASTLPFDLKVAHIHGGETTLGAIDNAYRHSISLMSKLHFCVTEAYENRLVELLGTEKGIFNVGSLSMDNMKHLTLLSIEEMKEKFGVDLSKPSILFTFHPETVAFEKNEVYIKEIISALSELDHFQLVITMPNNDTMGSMVRNHLNDFISKATNVFAIENFGTIGYLSAMKHCALMLGNTSSGFAEAAYFPKWVINLGQRQAGRYRTPNIVDVPEIEKSAILSTINQLKDSAEPTFQNPYGNGNTAEQIIKILKDKTV